MGMWDMIAIVVGLGVVSEMYSARLKAKTRWREQGEYVEGLADRLAKIERRLANLETLVVDREKHAAFEEAL